MLNACFPYDHENLILTAYPICYSFPTCVILRSNRDQHNVALSGLLVGGRSYADLTSTDVADVGQIADLGIS